MTVLQFRLRAEVEIDGDERGCEDVSWSGIELLVNCSGGMTLEEGVSCVVDCSLIALCFPVPARKNTIHRIAPFFSLRAK